VDYQGCLDVYCNLDLDLRRNSYAIKFVSIDDDDCFYDFNGRFVPSIQRLCVVHKSIFQS